MPIFLYKAKKANAETVTGQLSAEHEEEAIELIHQLGLLPVSVAVQNQKQSHRLSHARKKVKPKEVYFFSRQLANLLKAGLSLPRGLNIIEEQTQNPYLKEVTGRISWGVRNGRSFSECLSDFPKIFSSLFITLVRAGEESGRLQEMLVAIALYQRRQGEISSKVRSALTYPFFMAGVGVLSIYVIFTFVIPRMSRLFESIGEDLPLPTQVLLYFSGLLQKANLWILIVVLVLVLIVLKWIQSPRGKASISRFLLNLPLFGEIVMKVELARFCRTSVLLMESGVAITKALKVTIPILSNELIKTDLERCLEDLTQGGSFGESLKESGHLPAIMGHLISVGEEAGNLEEVFTEIADHYEQETNDAIKTMTTLLEPILILLIGLAVGFIVFAMLLPIFQTDVIV